MSDVDPEPLEQYLSTNTVAEMFDVTNETVRNWIEQGKLKGGKLGTIWRVSRTEAIRFANKNFGGE